MIRERETKRGRGERCWDAENRTKSVGKSRSFGGDTIIRTLLGFLLALFLQER